MGFWPQGSLETGGVSAKCSLVWLAGVILPNNTVILEAGHWSWRTQACALQSSTTMCLFEDLWGPSTLILEAPLRTTANTLKRPYMPHST